MTTICNKGLSYDNLFVVVFSNINLPLLIANIFKEQEPSYFLSTTPKLDNLAATSSFKSSTDTNKLHSELHSQLENGHFLDIIHHLFVYYNLYFAEIYPLIAVYAATYGEDK